jgi:hypothetical protein
MNKPSERIVVFVSPAQKRAIAATAERLGVSVSELMRRAVLSFGATSEQVKAASIVDRLRAPREPDALNAALQRVARGSKHVRENMPPVLKPASRADRPVEALTGDAFRATATPPAPLDPIAALAALATTAADNADSAVQAAARVTSAKAAALAAESPAASGTTTAALKRSTIGTRHDDDESGLDPTGEGRFA